MADSMRPQQHPLQARRYLLDLEPRMDLPPEADAISLFQSLLLLPYHQRLRALLSRQSCLVDRAMEVDANRDLQTTVRRQTILSQQLQLARMGPWVVCTPVAWHTLPLACRLHCRLTWQTMDPRQSHHPPPAHLRVHVAQTGLLLERLQDRHQLLLFPLALLRSRIGPTTDNLRTSTLL